MACLRFASDTEGGGYVPKEHQGGSPHTGRIAIGEWTEENFEVQITEAAYPEDSLCDQAREAIEKGEVAFEQFLVQQVEQRCQEERAANVAAVLTYLTEARNRVLAVDELVYAVGANTLERTNATILAKRHGVSKQAFSAGVRRAREALGLRKSVEMRDEKARENMRLRNKRQNKVK